MPKRARRPDDAADEPDAAPEPPRAAQDGNGETDPLRERLAAILARHAMSQDRFAKHAEVSQASISKFLAGKAISTRNRPKIEQALADLVG